MIRRRNTCGHWVVVTALLWVATPAGADDETSGASSRLEQAEHLELVAGDRERAFAIFRSVADDEAAPREIRARAWIGIAHEEYRRGNPVRRLAALEDATRLAPESSSYRGVASELLYAARDEWRRVVSSMDAFDWIRVLSENPTIRAQLLLGVTSLATPDREKRDSAWRTVRAYGAIAMPALRAAHGRATGALRVALARAMVEAGDLGFLTEAVSGEDPVAFARRLAGRRRYATREEIAAQRSEFAAIPRAAIDTRVLGADGAGALAILRWHFGDFRDVDSTVAAVPWHSLPRNDFDALFRDVDDEVADRARAALVAYALRVESLPESLVSLIVRTSVDAVDSGLLERASREVPEVLINALLVHSRFAEAARLLRDGELRVLRDSRSRAIRLPTVVAGGVDQATVDMYTCDAELTIAGLRGVDLDRLVAHARLARAADSYLDVFERLVRASWSVTTPVERGRRSPYPLYLFPDSTKILTTAGEPSARRLEVWAALVRDCPAHARAALVCLIAPELPWPDAPLDAVLGWLVTTGEPPRNDETKHELSNLITALTVIDGPNERLRPYRRSLLDALSRHVKLVLEDSLAEIDRCFLGPNDRDLERNELRSFGPQHMTRFVDADADLAALESLGSTPAGRIVLWTALRAELRRGGVALFDRLRQSERLPGSSDPISQCSRPTSRVPATCPTHHLYSVQ